MLFLSFTVLAMPSSAPTALVPGLAPMTLDTAPSACSGPGKNEFWLSGTHHKTGTILMDQFMHQVTGWGGKDGSSFGDKAAAACTQDVHNVTDAIEPTQVMLDKQKADADQMQPMEVPTQLETAGNGMYNNFLFDAKCVKQWQHDMNILRLRIIDTTPETWPIQLEAFREHAGKSASLKIIHSVRDPVDIIISGYFYDAAGSEPACRDVPSSMLKSAQHLCGDHDGDACKQLLKIDYSTRRRVQKRTQRKRLATHARQPPRGESGVGPPRRRERLRRTAHRPHAGPHHPLPALRLAEKNSWTDALQKLPPKHGVVLEALLMYNSFWTEATSAAALKKQSFTQVHQLDLGDVMSKFDGELPPRAPRMKPLDRQQRERERERERAAQTHAERSGSRAALVRAICARSRRVFRRPASARAATMKSVLSFLGVKKANECVQEIKDLDVSAGRSTSTFSSCVADAKKNGTDVSKLEGLLTKLGAKDVVNKDNWYTDYVKPGASRAKGVKHSCSPHAALYLIVAGPRAPAS